MDVITVSEMINEYNEEHGIEEEPCFVFIPDQYKERKGLKRKKSMENNNDNDNYHKSKCSKDDNHDSDGSNINTSSDTTPRRRSTRTTIKKKDVEEIDHNLSKKTFDRELTKVLRLLEKHYCPDHDPYPKIDHIDVDEMSNVELNIELTDRNKQYDFNDDMDMNDGSRDRRSNMSKDDIDDNDTSHINTSSDIIPRRRSMRTIVRKKDVEEIDHNLSQQTFDRELTKVLRLMEKQYCPDHDPYPKPDHIDIDQISSEELQTKLIDMDKQSDFAGDIDMNDVSRDRNHIDVNKMFHGDPNKGLTDMEQQDDIYDEMDMNDSSRDLETDIRQHLILDDDFLKKTAVITTHDTSEHHQTHMSDNENENFQERLEDRNYHFQILNPSYDIGYKYFRCETVNCHVIECNSYHTADDDDTWNMKRRILYDKNDSTDHDTCSSEEEVMQNNMDDNTSHIDDNPESSTLKKLIQKMKHLLRDHHKNIPFDGNVRVTHTTIEFEDHDTHRRVVTKNTSLDYNEQVHHDRNEEQNDDDNEIMKETSYRQHGDEEYDDQSEHDAPRTSQELAYVLSMKTTEDNNCESSYNNEVQNEDGNVIDSEHRSVDAYRSEFQQRQRKVDDNSDDDENVGPSKRIQESSHVINNIDGDKTAKRSPISKHIDEDNNNNLESSFTMYENNHDDIFTCNNIHVIQQHKSPENSDFITEKVVGQPEYCEQTINISHPKNVQMTDNGNVTDNKNANDGDQSLVDVSDHDEKHTSIIYEGSSINDIHKQTFEENDEDHTNVLKYENKEVLLSDENYNKVLTDDHEVTNQHDHNHKEDQRCDSCEKRHQSCQCVLEGTRIITSDISESRTPNMKTSIDIVQPSSDNAENGIMKETNLVQTEDYSNKNNASNTINDGDSESIGYDKNINGNERKSTPDNSISKEVQDDDSSTNEYENLEKLCMNDNITNEHDDIQKKISYNEQTHQHSCEMSNDTRVTPDRDKDNNLDKDEEKNPNLDIGQSYQLQQMVDVNTHISTLNSEDISDNILEPVQKHLSTTMENDTCNHQQNNENVIPSNDDRQVGEMLQTTNAVYDTCMTYTDADNTSHILSFPKDLNQTDHVFDQKDDKTIQNSMETERNIDNNSTQRNDKNNIPMNIDETTDIVPGKSMNNDQSEVITMLDNYVTREHDDMEIVYSSQSPENKNGNSREVVSDNVRNKSKHHEIAHVTDPNMSMTNNDTDVLYHIYNNVKSYQKVKETAELGQNIYGHEERLSIYYEDITDSDDDGNKTIGYEDNSLETMSEHVNMCEMGADKPDNIDDVTNIPENVIDPVMKNNVEEIQDDHQLSDEDDNKNNEDGLIDVRTAMYTSHVTPVDISESENHEKHIQESSCMGKDTHNDNGMEYESRKDKDIQVSICDIPANDDKHKSNEFIIINDMLVMYTDKNESQAHRDNQGYTKKKESEKQSQKTYQDETDVDDMKDEHIAGNNDIGDKQETMNTLTCKVLVMCSDDEIIDDSVDVLDEQSSSIKQRDEQSVNDVKKNDVNSDVTTSGDDSCIKIDNRSYQNDISSNRFVEDTISKTRSSLYNNDSNMNLGILVPYSDSEDGEDDHEHDIGTTMIDRVTNIEHKIIYKQLVLSSDTTTTFDKMQMNEDQNKNIRSMIDMKSNMSQKKVFVSFDTDDSDGTYSGGTSYSDIEQGSSVPKELLIMSNIEDNFDNHGDVNQDQQFDQHYRKKLEDVAQQLLHIYHQAKSDSQPFKGNRSLSTNDVIENIAEKFVSICLEEDKTQNTQLRKSMKNSTPHVAMKKDIIKKARLILPTSMESTKCVDTDKLLKENDINKSSMSNKEEQNEIKKFKDVGVQTILRGYHIQLIYDPQAPSLDLRNCLNNRRYDLLPDQQDVISSDLDMPHVPHISHQKTCIMIHEGGKFIYIYQTVP